ncbi:MAG TPA: hypothetical protein VMH35_28285 [Streptosporangiaceae bacterium]|nr:hypothetical protein [Streptosporangiaceae bacterium]
MVPVILLVQNNFDSAGFKPLGNQAATLAPPRDDYYGVPTEVYSANSNGTPADLCVTFELLGLNPSVPDVTLGVLVGVTSAGHAALSTLSKEGYRDVSVVIKSDIGLSNFEIPVAVSVLAAAPVTPCGAHPLQMNLDQDAAYRGNWTVSLLGQPRAFPQDWYELDDSVGVIAGQSQNGQAVPSSLVMMSRDEDLRVKAEQDQATYQHLPQANLPSAHQLFFTVRRPPWTVTYTYWVAAMPFLLLMGLLWFKRFAQRKPLEPSDAAFGLAAAMVAILPLHQVLVPSTIPGLTRLDLLFGLGICFLVAASLLWVVIWLPLLPYPEPDPSGGGTGNAGGAGGARITGTGSPGDGAPGVTVGS